MSKDADIPVVTPLTPELGCTDIAKSLAFYTQVLGFKIQYQREEDGFAMLERQGSRIMLDEWRAASVTGTDRSYALAPLEYPLGRGMNLQIQTDDVDELYAAVQKSGATIYRPMEEKWYRANDIELGNKQFIVLDPDGYMLRFYQDLGDRPCKAET
ncbi:MAG: VOC family protein [Alphaproteobacteria bacterium]|nr:VOC family protein [Alphaproteobacteria bacterium]